MIRQTWLLLGLVSVGAIAPFLISPANACTPSPDNPHGCAQINNRLRVPIVKGGGGGDGDPWPPNCPQCGQVDFHSKDPVILPDRGFQPQGDFGTRMLNPQPLPPKAAQIQY
jgi:hypothetical protein